MKINSVILKHTVARVSQYPTDAKCEFLLVGRSNVGKSSFINTLISRKNYARTSSKPGKTQTLNFYLVNDEFYLVDVPGYGYATTSKVKRRKFGLMIEEYLVKRENLKHVFMLIDYRHKPTEDDLLMYNYLKYYNVSVTVVATKYDKINKSAREKQDKMIINAMHITQEDSIVFFSAISKKGKEEIYEIIDTYLNN